MLAKKLLFSRTAVKALSRFRALSTCVRTLPQEMDSNLESSSPLTQLSEEENAMKDMVKKLAQDKIQPLVRQMDDQSRIDKTVIDLLFQNGLMSVDIDTKYGGTGSTFFTSMLVIEELSKVDPSVSIFCHIQNTIFTQTLMRYASDEQLDIYLPRVAKDAVGCFCLSESEAGSDAFSLRTRAKRSGNDWVINGTKHWITNADEADIFIVHANADPSKGHKGITAFIVERGTNGLSVGPREHKLGIRASSTCPVMFDNVRVPSSNMIGQIGCGYKYAIGSLNDGRIGIAAQMLGLAEGCLEQAVKYTMDRKQFGQRIFDFQAMQHQIAKIAVEIEAAKLLVYNSARLRDQNKRYIREASIAKYFAAEVAANTTNKCMEWMGGVGFTRDYPIEKFYRDCKIGSIYGGTSNVQLNTIAKIINNQMKYDGHL